jgi:hypothetical protein
VKLRPEPLARSLLFGFAVAVLPAQLLPAQVSPDVPVLRGGVRLDGRLDDDVWRDAVDLGVLTQREPREGVEPSERTEVRMFRDDDNLYLGITCHDSQPRGVVGAQMARDADLTVDDSIEIVIDTFRDLRNGYYFQVNPAGARADGLIANNGESSREWDGIWEAKTQRGPFGWSAEIALPFKTLNFDPARGEWGLNVQRTIKRKQETIRWRAPRQNIRLTQVSEAGPIGGLANIRQGHGLDVRPYVSGGVRSAGDGPHSGDADAGLDVVKNLSPRLSAVLTVNTDFAETEVDARQVNLTRFSLFFPEKRAFFLQNAGIFQAAGQGQRPDQGSGADLLPFFSRKIGLDVRGEPLPVLGGGKLAGRAGAWNIGLLDIHTRDFGPVEGRNFAVARLSRNVGSQSLIGVIATHGSNAGAARPLVGVDGRWSRSDFLGDKNLVVEGALFQAFMDEALPGPGDAWSAVGRIDYANDPLGINVSLKRIGERFDPGLGFVPRRGIVKGNYNIDYYQRPRKWGIRHQHWELLTTTVHHPDGRLLNWRIFTAPLNVRTESGEHIEWNYMPEYEYLDAPFEIFPGVVVPPGGYTMHRYRAEVNSATKRRLVGDVSVRYGEFYGGRRTESALSLRYKPSPHFAAQLSLSRNDVKLPQGSFKTNLWQARIDTAFTPDLTWTTFVQYDDVSRVGGVNSRFRWTPKQGSDVFLVVNLGRLREDGRWLPAYDRVTTKAQYTFRF